MILSSCPECSHALLEKVDHLVITCNLAAELQVLIYIVHLDLHQSGLDPIDRICMLLVSVIVQLLWALDL